MTEEKKEEAKVVPAAAPAVATPATPAVAAVPAPEVKPAESTEKK